MKLFAALGPGDIVGAARLRSSGETIPETSIAFSEQLFDYCRSNNIEILGISSHARTDKIQIGCVRAENRPKPTWCTTGAKYHLALLLYALKLALRARRFGADLAIIDSGTTHFFALTIFRLFGVRVAVNLHNVMWPVGYEPTGLNSLIRRLNRWFFRNVAAGGIGCSPECERQVLQESRSKIPFFQYRCQFSKDGFKPSAGYSGGPFRIVCASRAEVNKGILDLIPIAARLRSTGAPPVIFDVCGNGPALGELEKGVAEASLNGTVIVHGRVERAELLDLYSKSHAVIVPTRSTFTEGMPMVCAEAMLSSLPVITNPVTNAADVIGDAILLARTDDANSYAVEIRKLIEDKPLYQSLRLACARYVDQFVDPARGYAVSVDSLIKSLLPGLVN